MKLFDVGQLFMTGISGLTLTTEEKKFIQEYQLFVAEGSKMVNELLSVKFPIKEIYATSDFYRKTPIDKQIDRHEIKLSELERISSLSTPNEALAICKVPLDNFDSASLKDKLTLVLDNIKDPGNLGTIIRIADWFGIESIICSEETAYAYNPKVVQATMGSIVRVNLHYTNLKNFFSSEGNSGNQLPVFGALLEGENIYSKSLPASGLIIIGNESQGISDGLLPFITDKISIPSFSNNRAGLGEAESLNAAVATSIICSEFRRR